MTAAVLTMPTSEQDPRPSEQVQRKPPTMGFLKKCVKGRKQVLRTLKARVALHQQIADLDAQIEEMYEKEQEQARRWR